MQKTLVLSAVMMSLLLMFAFPVMADDHNDDDDDRDERKKKRAAPAFIRAIHLSPDAPNVDVWANGNVFLEDLGFTENSGFARVPSGEYNLQVVPTGATEPVVIDATIELQKYRPHTVLAVNTLDSIEAIVLKDDPFWIGNKNPAIRFVHASPDAPAVDIAVQDGPVLFSDVTFKEAEDFITVPYGEYDLEVRLAGTDTVVLEIDDVNLKRWTAYTAVATGFVGDETLDAQLYTNQKRFRFK